MQPQAHTSSSCMVDEEKKENQARAHQASKCLCMRQWLCCGRLPARGGLCHGGWHACRQPDRHRGIGRLPAGCATLLPCGEEIPAIHAEMPKPELCESTAHRVPCQSAALPWLPGLLHYQQNLDCYDSTYIITYNSEDPGTQVRLPPWHLSILHYVPKRSKTGSGRPVSVLPAGPGQIPCCW